MCLHILLLLIAVIQSPASLLSQFLCFFNNSLLVTKDIQEIIGKLLNRLMFLTSAVMLMLSENELKLRVQAHSVLVF